MVDVGVRVDVAASAGNEVIVNNGCVKVEATMVAGDGVGDTCTWVISGGPAVGVELVFKDTALEFADAVAHTKTSGALVSTNTTAFSSPCFSSVNCLFCNNNTSKTQNIKFHTLILA